MHAVDDAENIDVDHVAPVVQAVLLDGAANADARVVEEIIDAPMAGVSRFDHRGELVSIAHVEFHSGGRCAQRLRKCLSDFALAIGQNDGGTSSDEVFGQSGPNARSAAGDQGYGILVGAKFRILSVSHVLLYNAAGAGFAILGCRGR